MIKHFFTVALILLPAFVNAHLNHQRGVSTRDWSLNSGAIVKGNFLFFDNGRIYLEQHNGSVLEFDIKDFKESDQKILSIKIQKLKELNGAGQQRFMDSPSGFYSLIYLALMIALLWMLILLLKKGSIPISINGTLSKSIIVALIGFIIPACQQNKEEAMETIVIPRTAISFFEDAFSAFKPAISTSFDDTYFKISSNGIPNHNMMIGIKSWQQQVPITHSYNGTNSWSIPIQPEYADIPLSTKTNLMKGAVALAVNGIPIFNALNNRGEDSYLIGELDQWGGHCGRADDYHYHAAPLHLSNINGLKPIAFALDGFPVYGLKEPDGTSVLPLDNNHGHLWSTAGYHYHGTLDYPYVVGAMRGKVSLDPSTPAPENQILPQAFAKGVRPATAPLRGATIIAFEAIGTNGYSLKYQIGSKIGSVRYSWDASNKYTYILTDTAGIVTTSVFQR